MKKLRKSSSLNLHVNPKTDVYDYIRKGLEFHKKMGFDAADMPMGIIDLTNDNWQPVIERAAEDADELGVKFELCHLPFSGKVSTPSDYLPIFNAQMHRAIDAAAMLGVDYAVLHPNTTTLHMSKYDKNAERDKVLGHLAPFAAHADKVGLNIVVENMRIVHANYPIHRYCQTPEELCDIADTLGIGVCWDFGHANISGVKQSEGLAYVGKRLKVLHVNDNFAGDDIHILPFTGNVDWKDAMRGLALAEFDGLFNFELSIAKIPAALREDFVKYALHAADEIMGYLDKE
jgi:sugar phosphate isomerase/epimerase